eukprot:COSAG02_NODE_22990_length_733_cov_1.042587_1_plen_165_part_10
MHFQLMGCGCDCDCVCHQHHDRCDEAAAVYCSQAVSPVDCALVNSAETYPYWHHFPIGRVLLPVCCACCAPLPFVLALVYTSSAAPSVDLLSHSQTSLQPTNPYAAWQAWGSRAECVPCGRGCAWTSYHCALREPVSGHHHCRCCRHQSDYGYCAQSCSCCHSDD